MVYRLPGSSVHGIFQARILEWGAIAFSEQDYIRYINDIKIFSILTRYKVAEKAMAPHSSTLAWKIPWMEEPGRLQSMRSQRVGHD